MSVWVVFPRHIMSKSKSSNLHFTSSTLARENFLAIAPSQSSSCSKSSRKLSFLAFFCWFSFSSFPSKTSKFSTSLARADVDDIFFFISLFLIFLYSLGRGGIGAQLGRHWGDIGAQLGRNWGDIGAACRFVLL